MLNTLQKEWLEAFDQAKKFKLKKQDNASVDTREQPNSYNEAFNRKLHNFKLTFRYFRILFLFKFNSIRRR